MSLELEETVSAQEALSMGFYASGNATMVKQDINEETPMEDLCMNCFELRNHSCIPCKDKKNKEAEKSQETLTTPDDPPQLTVPMPMGKIVAEETAMPVIERSSPQESPKLSYSDALKKGSVQSQDTLKTSNYSQNW